MQVAMATLEATLLTQMLRPVIAQAGPAGEYAAQTFTQLLVMKMERDSG